jgi:hypothetical protein
MANYMLGLGSQFPAFSKTAGFIKGNLENVTIE